MNLLKLLKSEKNQIYRAARLQGKFRHNLFLAVALFGGICNYSCQYHLKKFRVQSAQNATSAEYTLHFIIVLLCYICTIIFFFGTVSAAPSIEVRWVVLNSKLFSALYCDCMTRTRASCLEFLWITPATQIVPCASTQTRHTIYQQKKMPIYMRALL